MKKYKLIHIIQQKKNMIVAKKYETQEITTTFQAEPDERDPKLIDVDCKGGDTVTIRLWPEDRTVRYQEEKGTLMGLGGIALVFTIIALVATFNSYPVCAIVTGIIAGLFLITVVGFSSI